MLRYSVNPPTLILALSFCHGITASQPCDSMAVSPSDWVGFVSRITQQWSTNIVISGYKGMLNPSIITPLRNGISAKESAAAFYENWKYQEPTHESQFNADEEKLINQTRQKPIKFAVLRTMIKTLGPLFLRISSLKLMSDILKFAAPKLLGALLRFVNSDDDISVGYIISLSFFVTCMLASLFESNYFENMNCDFTLRMRGALISAIYRKALNQDNAAKNRNSMGEVINLMSVDCEVLAGLMPYINVVWSSPFQIIMAIYFLWQEIGIAALAGVGVLIVLFPVNFFTGRIVRALDVKQMKLKDERIKITNEVLGGIRVIKLYGWEDPFQAKINNIRKQELACMRKVAIVNSIGNLTWNIAPFLVTFLSFLVYVAVDENHILNR